MKICITSQGSTLDALAEESRFGRAPFFLLLTRKRDHLKPLKTSLPEGIREVGPKAAQMVYCSRGESTGQRNGWGNAHEVLQAAGIQLYVYCACGTVRDALEQFNKNPYSVQ